MGKKGHVRAVDELGRIVLPIEMRKALNVSAGDDLVIGLEGQKITIERKVPTCIFCNSEDDLTVFNDKPVCRNCINKLSEK